jgi:hypothetical protein
MDPRGRVGFVPGWQWLTKNPNFGMEWARPSPFSGRLYQTDEIRIEIEIPEIEEKLKLVHWVTMRNARNPQSREFLDTFPDHREWYLFKGEIPPAWFRGFENNPTKDPIVIPSEN